MAHNPITSNLIDLIKDQVVSYERLLRGKNLELRLDLPHQLPEMKLDPILFKEALQNLLDNAMDYNQELGGFVDLTVTEAEHEYGQIEGQGKVTTHAEPSILIRVTNPGLDIPKEEMEKIFDQFYRSSQALQHHPNGNGLGLFLAQAIIQQHGGKIEVESQKGLTSFTICLPWRTIKV